jgi:Ca-activated chloride channel family protein
LAEELLAVKLRYKQPEGATSQLQTFPLKDSQQAFTETDRDFQWAATVAQFGMLLRGSQHAGQSTWESLLEQAIAAAGVSPDASRQECLEMIRKCQPTTYVP